MHRIQQLYFERKARATRPYLARGNKIERCELCMLSRHYCICQERGALSSEVSFCLIMHDSEVLKPSNSGRLIADLFEDTYGFIWNRTKPEPTLLELLKQDKYQPYVVFPDNYALPQQPIARLNGDGLLSTPMGKRPLFILLDGSWREAKKMYRKSAYLHQYPLLSITQLTHRSPYSLRENTQESFMATAEVAANVVALADELHQADTLLAWFEVHCEASMLATTRERKNYQRPMDELQREFREKRARCC